jgi:hypothetical protein
MNLIDQPCPVCRGKKTLPSGMTGVPDQKCWKCNGHGTIQVMADAPKDEEGKIDLNQTIGGPILPGSRWRKYRREDGKRCGDNVFAIVVDVDDMKMVDWYYENAGRAAGRNKWPDFRFRSMFVPAS